MKIVIGEKAYKRGRNDYAEMRGTIEYCSTCCKAFRVQFDKIANNEALANFNLDRCKITKR